MAYQLAQFSILACLFCGLCASVTKPVKLDSCKDFTRGQVFNESEVFGTWHLLHFQDKLEPKDDSGEPHCVEFFPVDDVERQQLSEPMKFVEYLKLENVTLKLLVPCSRMKSNRRQVSYLQRLAGDGSYRALRMPSPTEEHQDLEQLHRYQVRLKILGGVFMGMMDCHDKFLLLLAKRTDPEDLAITRLRTIVNVYWPPEEE